MDRAGAGLDPIKNPPSATIGIRSTSMDHALLLPSRMDRPARLLDTEYMYRMQHTECRIQNTEYILVPGRHRVPGSWVVGRKGVP